MLPRHDLLSPFLCISFRAKNGILRVNAFSVVHCFCVNLFFLDCRIFFAQFFPVSVIYPNRWKRRNESFNKLNLSSLLWKKENLITKTYENLINKSNLIKSGKIFRTYHNHNLKMTMLVQETVCRFEERVNARNITKHNRIIIKLLFNGMKDLENISKMRKRDRFFSPHMRAISNDIDERWTRWRVSSTCYRVDDHIGWGGGG